MEKIELNYFSVRVGGGVGFGIFFPIIINPDLFINVVSIKPQ